MLQVILSNPFSVALLALNVGAAAVAFLSRDAAKGAYWCASAVCILVVTLR